MESPVWVEQLSSNHRIYKGLNAADGQGYIRRKAIMALNAKHEIGAWIVLLVFIVIICLFVYVVKLKVKLRKYEKLYRSQSDINESISALTTKLNTALEEIKTDE
jgi:beta-lactamase regulating signal transducer with metallopeptidase domain